MSEDTRTYSRAELEEAAALAAGATSGVFMRAVPEMVMPSGEVSEAVGLALAEFDERRERPASQSAPRNRGMGDDGRMS